MTMNFESFDDQDGRLSGLLKPGKSPEKLTIEKAEKPSEQVMVHVEKVRESIVASVGEIVFLPDKEGKLKDSIVGANIIRGKGQNLVDAVEAASSAQLGAVIIECSAFDDKDDIVYLLSVRKKLGLTRDQKLNLRNAPEIFQDRIKGMKLSDLFHFD